MHSLEAVCRVARHVWNIRTTKKLARLIAEEGDTVDYV